MHASFVKRQSPLRGRNFVMGMRHAFLLNSKRFLARLTLVSDGKVAGLGFHGDPAQFGEAVDAGLAAKAAVP